MSTTPMDLASQGTTAVSQRRQRKRARREKRRLGRTLYAIEKGETKQPKARPVTRNPRRLR